MHRRLRYNDDRRLREMSREFLESGDPELGEVVARALLRSGMIPEKERYLPHSATSGPTALNILPSFTAIMPDGGPALCLVPINDQILHVRIAPAGTPVEHDWLEANEQRHMYGEGEEPWPGLPVNQGAYMSRQRRQGYAVKHVPCVGEFPPYYHQQSPKAKRWPAYGAATVHVDPETMAVQILRLYVRFHSGGGRSQPPRYTLRATQLRAALRPRLQRFLEEWVQENHEVFAQASSSVDATVVTRALHAVDNAHERVEREMARLVDARQELANVLGALLASR
jgi:hypothetical protein